MKDNNIRLLVKQNGALLQIMIKNIATRISEIRYLLHYKI